MLPCQNTCAMYCVGCHKSCGHWRAFQEEQQVQRAAQKRCWEYHTQRFMQTPPKLLRLQAWRPIWKSKKVAWGPRLGGPLSTFLFSVRARWH